MKSCAPPFERLSAAEAAASAAEAAASAADTARRFEELTQRHGEPTAESEYMRYLCIRWFIVGSLAVTLVPVFYVGHAFQSQDPSSSSSYGGLALYNEPAPSTGLEEQAGGPRPELVASNPFDASGQTVYQLFFPATYGGTKFALALSRDAVMDEVQVILPSDTRQVTIRNEVPEVRPCADRDAPGVVLMSKGEPVPNCQLIVEEIPHIDGKPVNTACFPADHGDYIEVDILGRSKNLSSTVDWAHQAITTPALFPAFVGLSNSATESWDGRPFGAEMIQTSPGMCQLVPTDEDWEDYLSIPNPNYSDITVLVWTNPEAAVDVIATRSNATIIGNLLLLVIGAGFGLSIGFIPVAYEARRSWKKAERQQLTPE